MAETIAQILERVGQDAGLAQTEMVLELRRSKTRKTLIEALELVLDGDPLTPPAGLEGSARFWRQTLETYSLRVDEMRVLEDACRTMDLIDRIELELGSSSLMELGSMGQPVASPLVSEIRQHRSTLRQLLAQLKLPDEPGAGQPRRSEAARSAAIARWGGR